MTDGNPVYTQIGQGMEDHSTAIHSQGEYASPITGARASRHRSAIGPSDDGDADATISNTQRALVSVHPKLGGLHLQRYLDEIVGRQAPPRARQREDGRTDPSLRRGPDQDDRPLDADPDGRADAGSPPVCRRAAGATVGVLRAAVAVGVTDSHLPYLSG